MAIGLSVRLRLGYEGIDLGDWIGEVLACNRVEHRLALIGIGNLERAILVYFAGQSKMLIVSVFDVNESKVDHVMAGCRKKSVLPGIHQKITATPAKGYFFPDFALAKSV